jgi:NADPH-dependent glutamate synthase beta chain and related oxidoreductases
MDCCRTSLRVGSDKTVIVYRRSLEEAPASKEEIADAMEEGVVFNFLHNPVEIILKEGRVSAVKCEVMKLGEPDESGRKKPEGTGVFETYPCDNIIMAIGQNPDANFTEHLGLTTNHGYIVSTDGISTSDPQVYAGGDIVRGADTVVRSMVDGKKAAQKILADLTK